MHGEDLLSAMSCSPNSDCVLRVASSCPSIAVLTGDIHEEDMLTAMSQQCLAVLIQIVC
jgi:hypothetical protein